MAKERVEIAIAQSPERREIVSRANAGAEPPFVNNDRLSLETIESVHVLLPCRRSWMRRSKPVAGLDKPAQLESGIVKSTHEVGSLFGDAVVERALFEPLAGADPAEAARDEHDERKQPLLPAEPGACDSNPFQDFRGEQHAYDGGTGSRDIERGRRHPKRSDTERQRREDASADDRPAEDFPDDRPPHAVYSDGSRSPCDGYAVIAAIFGLPAAAGVSVALARRIRNGVTATAGIIALALSRRDLRCPSSRPRSARTIWKEERRGNAI